MKKMISSKSLRYLFEILVAFVVYVILLGISYLVAPRATYVIHTSFLADFLFFFAMRELCYSLDDMIKSEKTIIVVDIAICIVVSLIYTVLICINSEADLTICLIQQLLIFNFLFINGGIAEVKKLRRTKLREEEMQRREEEMQRREEEMQRREERNVESQNATMKFFVENDWNN